MTTDTTALFARTGEQQMLSDSLSRFLDANNSLEQRRARLAENPHAGDALWPGLAELGILGAAFDEQMGGLSGDPRTIAVVMSELGHALALEPVLQCTVVAGYVLARWADHKQRDATAEAVIAGTHRIVLAHDAGPDPFRRPTMDATEGSDSIRLSGVVRCVHAAHLADEFFVTAAKDGDTLVVRVPATQAGLQLDTYQLMDGSSASDLHFTNAELSPTARMTFSEPADQVVREALERGCLGLAAEAAGILQALNRATFQYLLTRRQFGAALATFQALQHRAADMFMAFEGLRHLVDMALDSVRAPDSPARSAWASAVKAEADRAGRLIGHESVQLHGGMGVSEELSVSHCARRLATIRATFGTADVHHLRWGAL